MREYQAFLRDEILFEKPITEGEDQDHHVASLSPCSQSW